MLLRPTIRIRSLGSSRLLHRQFTSHCPPSVCDLDVSLGISLVQCLFSTSSMHRFEITCLGRGSAHGTTLANDSSSSPSHYDRDLRHRGVSAGRRNSRKTTASQRDRETLASRKPLSCRSLIQRRIQQVEKKFKHEALPVVA